METGRSRKQKIFSCLNLSEWMDGLMEGRFDGWVDGWIDGPMYFKACLGVGYSHKELSPFSYFFATFS